MKKKFAQLFVVPFFVVACAHNRGPTSEGQAMVAPVGESFEVSNNVYSLLKDLAASNNERVYFKLSSQVMVDRDKADLREKAKNALHEAFGRSFTDIANNEGSNIESSIGGVIGKFKGHLPTTLMENFVYTIEVFKLFGMDLRYQLAWTPQLRQYQNFESELGSNDLMPLWRQGRLSSSLAKLQKPTTLQDILAYSETVKEDRAFLGGGFILDLRVVDLELAKRAPALFSGQIVLRRYIKHSLPKSSGMSRSEKVEISSAGWESRSSHVVSTLDYVYKIDASQKKVEFVGSHLYPGAIVITKDQDQIIHSQNRLVLKGQVSGLVGLKDKFNVTLKKIVFNKDFKVINGTETEIETSELWMRDHVKAAVLTAARGYIQDQTKYEMVVGGLE